MPDGTPKTFSFDDAFPGTQTAPAKPRTFSFDDAVGPDYTGWDTATPQPPIGMPQPAPFLADQPGYQYGEVLPFRKNLATGEIEPAVPEAIRAPVRGVQIDPMRFNPADPQQRGDLAAAASLLVGVRAPGEFSAVPPKPLSIPTITFKVLVEAA